MSDGSNTSCVGAGTFADNSAGIEGGAVHASGGSTISCGASWLNNVAGDIGGAIRVLGGSTFSWDEESFFAYNTAGRAGGALSVNGSSLSWNAATGFDSNTAGLVGGALHVGGGSSVSWSEATTFVRNFAEVNGGALAMGSSSKTSWSGVTTYLGNEAGNAGGAIYVEDRSNVSWSGETESVFDENLAGVFGGAAYVTTSSELSCGEQTSSSFFRNSATKYGGALQVDHGSSLALSGNTSFHGNSALGYPVNEDGTGHGGAIGATYSATVTWSETTSFTNNTAVLGAGLYAGNSSVLFLGHTIAAHNTATFGGGAFFFSNSSAVWDGQTDMYNNSAESAGGAVTIASSDLVINGPTALANNRVGDSESGFGGAMYMLMGSSLFASGATTWINNSAGGQGGAIMMDGSTAWWTGPTLFSGNSAHSASSNGGAVHVGGLSSVSWSGATTFTDNRSGRNGGALFLLYGEASWTVVTKFVRNTADSLGGALYVSLSRMSWSAATEFDGNSALSGGSIFMWNSSHVEWTGDTEFISNEASLDGGVIGSFSTDSVSNQGSTLVMNGTTAFVNNTCGANGGALALLGGLAVNIGTENVSFIGNAAEVAGGAVFVSGTGFGPIFTGARFISNSAQVGGAVSTVGSGNLKENADISPPNPTTFDHCHFIDNRATATGGAIDSAAGQDAFVNSTFQGNRAGTGGGLRLAGTASLDTCSFVDNISDDQGGAAVSNIGSLLSVENITFSGNVFDCDPGMYLDYNASGNPYEAACGGCETACDGCFFEPPVPPTCTDVMEHITSAGGTVTLEDLPVERGYWRASPSSEEVFACYNSDACLGGVTGRAGYCLKGYEGPYCAVCSDGYTTELAFACTRCSGGAGRIALAAVLAVVVLCVAFAVASYAMSGRVGDVRSGVVARLGQYIPLQSVKIVIVAWQILTQFTSVANVTYPDVYKRFLDGLDVFNFDLSWVLSAGCIFDIDFHDRLLASTVSPVIGLLFLAGTYAAAVSMNRGKAESLQVIWNKHVSLVLLLTFLIYSSVSATLFKAFVCEELEDGTNYLRADYTIDCDSSKHKAFQVYAGFMVVVYVVGIPALYAFLLFRDRHVLKDHHADREQTARTTSTSDLWKPYKPSVFYYEVIECGRRVLLAGVVVFIFPNTAAQIAITLMMAFAFVMVSEGLAPFASKWDAWLNRTGHTVVFVSMYIALLLKVDVSGERAGSQRVYEIVLVAAHACMILAVMTETFVLTWSLKVEQRQEPTTRFRHGKLFRSGRGLESAQDDPFSADLRRVEVSPGR
ncbi:polymorphic Outer membrane protein G/I family [Ectocarpus siliculosus]|uniref:Polymorphic Outer membrane protein G/I family n=1 Tax=Ectocarpus siliculosus TaxID=2880 RepID=D7G301_ECTSI|nr:polymorphic Outer membrane protein G/I family [Ectocarpus siliculosus]|eukprot:CBJ48858.1 polymorphic Outer membrane protein G/I family [Ectocarpus siliculosus]